MEKHQKAFDKMVGEAKEKADAKAAKGGGKAASSTGSFACVGTVAMRALRKRLLPQ